MALKPERIRGSDPQLLSAVESVADTIENHIYTYAKQKYGNRFVLERFTEVDWNVYEKPSIFFRPDKLLFKIFFHEQPPHYGIKYCLMATFLDLSLKDSEESAIVARFCEQLSHATDLPVRPWAGSVEFGWKNYLRP